MRCRAVAGLLLFVAALVALRSAIVWLDAAVELRAEHSEVVHRRDIDPAALFYTDSALALAAEKQLRQRTAESRP